MTKQVDSYRFLDFLTRKTVKGWIVLEEPRDIPWTALAGPLSQCTVALVTSGGLALKSDQPFDQEIERQNPWWCDPGFRVIPATATTAEITCYHLHVDTTFVHQDVNCLLPLDRLHDLAASGEIGAVAPRHYSFMGYTCLPETLLSETTPAMISLLKEDAVDLVVLVPS